MILLVLSYLEAAEFEGAGPADITAPPLPAIIATYCVPSTSYVIGAAIRAVPVSITLRILPSSAE